MSTESVKGGDLGPDASDGSLAAGLLGAPPEQTASSTWARRMAGYALIGLVVVTWVGQSEVAQLVEDTDYDRPYLITYINHSSCLLLAPAQGLVLLLLRRRRHGPQKSVQSWPPAGMSILLIALIYQFADWVWYLGLASTTVADGTIIFNSMSVFVFLLEWARRKDQMTLWKAAAVLASLAGVACVVELGPGGAAGGGQATEGVCLGRVMGNLCVLLAAALYAVYQVCIDQVVESQDVVTTNVIVSLQGVATLVALWPGMLLLDGLPLTWCAHERLSWPPAPAAWGLAANCALAFSFNVFFCLAIVTASPLLTSVGCTLTVPASLLADLLLHGDPIQPGAAMGSVLVLAGFLMLALAPQRGLRES